jgi:hypothetical protein
VTTNLTEYLYKQASDESLPMKLRQQALLMLSVIHGDDIVPVISVSKGKAGE